jgi:hypothetical protein
MVISVDQEAYIASEGTGSNARGGTYLQLVPDS